MQVFPAITPWNVYDLRLRHYLALTAVIDARRTATRKEPR